MSTPFVTRVFYMYSKSCDKISLLGIEAEVGLRLGVEVMVTLLGDVMTLYAMLKILTMLLRFDLVFMSAEFRLHGNLIDLVFPADAELNSEGEGATGSIGDLLVLQL